jgi:hypothetical protein
LDLRVSGHEQPVFRPHSLPSSDGTYWPSIGALSCVDLVLQTNLMQAMPAVRYWQPVRRFSLLAASFCERVCWHRVYLYDCDGAMLRVDLEHADGFTRFNACSCIDSAIGLQSQLPSVTGPYA